MMFLFFFLLQNVSRKNEMKCVGPGCGRASIDRVFLFFEKGGMRREL